MDYTANLYSCISNTVMQSEILTCLNANMGRVFSFTKVDHKNIVTIIASVIATLDKTCSPIIKETGVFFIFKLQKLIILLDERMNNCLLRSTQK